MDDFVPRQTWQLGKIIRTHNGSDGMTKAVTLQTKCGKINRPIQKLVKLELQISNLILKNDVLIQYLMMFFNLSMRKVGRVCQFTLRHLFPYQRQRTHPWQRQIQTLLLEEVVKLNNQFICLILFSNGFLNRMYILQYQKEIF